MPRSIELFEQRLLGGELRIDFNPCLRWNAANTVIEEDKNGNRVFNKRRSNGCIDGVVALAMAIGAAEAVEEETGDLDSFLTNPIMIGL